MTAAQIMDRIWDRTIPVPECGCYVWLGALDENGYGLIRVDGKTRRVHRVVYEQLVGLIPEGLTLDHLCRVCSCCRPEHLEPVTNHENVLRGIGPTAVNARKTHCNRGHPLSGHNLISLIGDRRDCRECRRLRRRSAEFRAHQNEYRRQKRASRKAEKAA